jgi:hypothetical protein
MEERYYVELINQFEKHLNELTVAAREKVKTRLYKIAVHTSTIFVLKLENKSTKKYEKLVEANVKGLQVHLTFLAESQIRTMLYDAGAVLVKLLRGAFL